jgi:hypothetical protein
MPPKPRSEPRVPKAVAELEKMASQRNWAFLKSSAFFAFAPGQAAVIYYHPTIRSRLFFGGHAMRCLTWSAMLLSLTLALLEGRAADPVDPDAAKLRAKLLNAPYIEGQLTGVEGEEKKFSITAIDKVQTVNQKAQQQLAQAQQNYQNALRGKNQGAINNAAKAISDAQAKLYDTKEVSHDFDLQGTKNFSLRTLITPTKDDGTKYTSVELAGLKGNSGLPGYAAKIEAFEKGAWVRAYLDKNKLRDMKKDSDAPLPLTTLVLIPEPKEKPKK